MSATIYILLAEDNPADAFLVEEALSLTKLDFHLARAADGEAASKLLAEMENQRATFNLILLDLNLPKISGHQLLAEIRSSEQLRTTPVIVLTSSDSPHDRAKAAAFNINHYFRKPCDLQAFLRLGGIVEAVFRSQSMDSQSDVGA